MPQPTAMLVVDDNPVDREIHGAIARRLGYEVLTACNGLEAIEVYRRHRPEVMLVDVDMPLLDGLATARQLYELDCPESDQRCIIIAVTGLPEPPAGAVGIAAWLPKPLDEQRLRETLARLGAPLPSP